MFCNGMVESRGAGRRRMPALRRAPSSCGGQPPRAYGSREMDRRKGAAHTLGRCTRVACAAVISLVLLGENTSARSSLPSCHGGTAAAASSARSRHHQQAWQLFAPKTSSPSKRAALAVALKRRARLPRRVTGAGGGSAVSPAQMYRVTRGTPGGGAQRQQQQQQRFAPDDRESRGGASGGSSSIEQLQSPRSAELLTVYTSSSASSSTAAAAATPQLPSIAEDIGGGVVSQGQGEGARPALPLLTEEDLTQLRAGQRVQKQKREGGSGSGSVVVDVRADPDVVLGLLTKYEDYADMIDTVRQCEVFPIGETDDARKVEVTVSRFKLHIRVVMSLLRERNMVQFELDPDCTKAGRAVLRQATGFFYVESPPDRPGFSRVWMLAKVDVNRFVPGAVVDYAAGRALPRASNWIKPTCEAAQRRLLRSAGKE
ncbi:unnamed protein product [Pylaiella littoralis]